MSLFIDSDSDDVEDIVINEKYAKSFVERERDRELHRAKHLDLDSLDEESSESEDDDGELLSTKLELDVINTINSIRKKDPRIYDKQSKWFEDDEQEIVIGMNKKKRFKDVIREQILETVDEMTEQKQSENNKKSDEKQKKLTYDEEQESIRKTFLESLNQDDDHDDILVVKSNNQSEFDEMRQKKISEALSEMTALIKLDADEMKKDEFLKNYITNKKWIDRTSKITQQLLASDVLEQEEEELDEVDRFESKYNFRFEELEQDESMTGRTSVTAYQVQGHSRNVEGSVRRIDESRKLQRESRQERKSKELRQKEAELMRLKNLKKQEVRCC
jgi:protein KRI1